MLLFRCFLCMCCCVYPGLRFVFVPPGWSACRLWRWFDGPICPHVSWTVVKPPRFHYVYLQVCFQYTSNRVDKNMLFWEKKKIIKQPEEEKKWATIEWYNKIRVALANRSVVDCYCCSGCAAVQRQANTWYHWYACGNKFHTVYDFVEAISWGKALGL